MGDPAEVRADIFTEAVTECDIKGSHVKLKVGNSFNSIGAG